MFSTFYGISIIFTAEDFGPINKPKSAFYNLFSSCFVLMANNLSNNQTNLGF
eukprot:UN21609